MFSLANGCRRTAVTIPRFLTAHHLTVRCASRISIPTPPPFPVVERCPSPTCQCREIPEPLDIDTDSPLNNTTAAYAEQILVSTGHSGWKSRIEEDEDAVFVRQLKKYLGRGGKFSDVSTQGHWQQMTTDTHAAIPQCSDHKLILHTNIG